MILSEPVLPRSWKKRYPFRTGTTSFIFPAGYAENVDRLGPYVDEIELLMFESRPESRPDGRLIRDLAELAKSHDIRYNVHLPADLDLTHPDPADRKSAGRILQRFVTTLLPLEPTVFVLHLPPPAHVRGTQSLAEWQRTAAASLANVLQVGLSGRRMALENQSFPFDWLIPILETLDLSVCLDTGHLALQGRALEPFLAAFGPRIAIGHLHGLHAGRDHAALGGLPPGYRHPLARWLAGFDGTVSLEVFALDPLRASLVFLDELMAPRGEGRD